MNCYQSHFIEIAQGAIFMEQNMRFGLIGNTEKKIGADYEQLLRAVFLCFVGKNLFNILSRNTLTSALKSCIIFLSKFILSLKISLKISFKFSFKISFKISLFLLALK